jgi:hypothetical protein
MMRPDDGTVDHLDCLTGIFDIIQRFQQELPETTQGPSAELPVDRGPLAEEVGKVAPLRSRSGDPEDPVEDTAVITRAATAVSAARRHERLEKFPFLVAHQSTHQRRLLPKATLNQKTGSVGIIFVNRT